MFRKKNNHRAGGARRKKLQNERIKRRRRPGLRHRLEVNPRSKVADRMRMKRGAWAGMKIALCCVAALGSVAALKAGAEHMFFNNPEIVVEKISVTTDGALTPAKIVEAAGIAEGDNALKIDLDATRGALESLPEVVSAAVRREIPGGIEITVKERSPVAWLECEDLQLAPFRTRNGCLLAEDGVAIPCHSLTRDSLRLPVVRVDQLSRVKYGAPVDSKYVRAALRLIEMNDRILFEEQLEIRTIEVPNPYSLLAVYANDAEVTFGMHDMDRQMADFKVVVDNAETQGWRIATLNLLVEDNVPVTFFSGAPAGYEEAAGIVDPLGEAPMNSGAGASRRQSDARAILGTLY